MGVAAPEEVSLWIGTVPDTFRAGRVSVVSQSGSIAEALLGIGPRAGFRSVVSSGAEAVTDAADVLGFFAEDEGTGAIGLFLETVRRPAEFVLALEGCAEAGKPVVCLKVGRSQAAARAALAHTGAVVGSERAFSALLRRHGAVEVDDFTALVETLEVLGRARRPRGKRIAAISESGGEGALLADQGEAAGIPFEPLPDSVTSELTARFPNYRAPGNPLDAWAIDEAEAVFPRSIEVLVGSGAFDIVIAQADQSQFRGAEEHEWCFMIVKALAEATVGTDTFPAVTTVSAVDPRPEVAEYALEHDVALLRGPRDAMRALAAAASLRPASGQPEPRAPVELADLIQEGPLPEFESALVLERYGVPLAPRRRAASPEEAAEAAAELGFPVVVKVDGPAHKAAQNGVVLGLGDEDGVRGATQRLGGRVLVASQAEGGAEAFCGMTRDPDFGPVLAVGLGGRAVESLSLAAVSLAPLGEEDARQLVAEAPGLETSPAAQEALAATLVALGRLAVDHPRIAAVDVNPLILSADGAVAVDALVVVEGESQ
jgi:acetyltransferase